MNCSRSASLASSSLAPTGIRIVGAVNMLMPAPAIGSTWCRPWPAESATVPPPRPPVRAIERRRYGTLRRYPRHLDTRSITCARPPCRGSTTMMTSLPLIGDPHQLPRQAKKTPPIETPKITEEPEHGSHDRASGRARSCRERQKPDRGRHPVRHQERNGRYVRRESCCWTDE